MIDTDYTQELELVFDFLREWGLWGLAFALAAIYLWRRAGPFLVIHGPLFGGRCRYKP